MFFGSFSSMYCMRNPLCSAMCSLSWYCVFSLHQILGEALLECHERAAAAGTQFAPLSVVVNRNRLRDEGATHLANAYKVSEGEALKS